jgi:hypothetical protein
MNGTRCRYRVAGEHGGLAVFGAARSWFQNPNRIPAEEMAAKIEALVRPVFLSAVQ